MKLAAIYNVWDAEELLNGSMKSIQDGIDLFIIIYQTVSNFGEHYTPKIDLTGIHKQVILHHYNPIANSGHPNEIAKRNIGLHLARENKCDYFLHIDNDEYYSDFEQAKNEFLNSGAHGSVVRLHTYFKLPTLRYEIDESYHVPFIHKLKPDTVAGAKQYPFYVDPTRRINTTDVVLLPFYMHHFSFVRNDIERKFRNSSAKNNLAKSGLMKAWHEAKAGYYVEDYKTHLIEVENIFQIKTPANQ